MQDWVAASLTMRFRLNDMERRFQQEQEVLLMTARRLAAQFTESQEELLPMLESLEELVREKQHMAQ